MKDTTFRAISTVLAVGLVISLFPYKPNERAKSEFQTIVTVLWLFYAVYYDNYVVGVICGLILLLMGNKAYGSRF